jgi:hypothetical protein
MGVAGFFVCRLQHLPKGERQDLRITHYRRNASGWEVASVEILYTLITPISRLSLLN